MVLFNKKKHIKGESQGQKQPKLVIKCCHVQKLAIILKQNKWNIVMLPQKYHSLVIKHNTNL